jgi:hypothetical protein
MQMRSCTVNRTRVQNAQLTVSGCVSGLCQEVNTSVVSVVQLITVNWLQGLTVRATTGGRPSCLGPYRQLPALDSIILFFTGELIAVEGGVAAVIVDDIEYHSRPNEVPFE